MAAWGNCNFGWKSAKTLFVFLLAIVAALPAFGQDNQPPVLVSFTFSPTAINTTTSSATVTTTEQITDNLSGVYYGDATFLSPSGQQEAGCSSRLISGTDLDGTWQCTITFPAYGEAGTWTVSNIIVVDNVGNYQYYYTNQLQAMGFPTTLQVTSNQDTQPPVLTGFSFNPAVINTTTSSATVTTTEQITDNLSGVYYGDATFISPSGEQEAGCSSRLISGTGLDGTWQCTVTFPAYGEAGTWTVSNIIVVDNVGNYQYYYTSQLQAMGFPTTLQVTSNQDTQPPVLTGFSFSPTAINTTTSSATVTTTEQITDNLSGVYYGDATFLSPSGQQEAGCSSRLISGTDLDGTWQCTITFPAYGEAGTWTVYNVVVVDNVGNYQYYYTSQLQAMGFPTQLQVDEGTVVALISSANPSSYAQPVTFTATVTSGVGIIPTGTVNFNDGSTTIGSGTLNSSGVATFTTSSLAVGTHSIVAAYLGDSNNPVASSPQLSQVITQAATMTTVASSLNPSTYGHPVKFTAAVSFANGTPPNGEVVDFHDGQTKLGTGTLANGAATFATPKLKAGVHHIWASYAGDANLLGSQSAELRQVVKP
jgi:hypothetical protein